MKKLQPFRNICLVLSGFYACGCLQGDPNPYDEQSSNTSGSGSANSSGGSSNTASGSGGFRSDEQNELPPSADVARGDGRSPITEGSECALSSTVPVNLQFQNDYPDRSLTMFWVDYGCQEIEYVTLAPGQSYNQASYATHPWRLRSQGVLMHEYIADEQATQLIPLP